MIPSISIPSLHEDLAAALDAARAAMGPVDRSRRLLEQGMGSDEPIYGVNTGFGALASQTISPDRLLELQRNLIISHAVGVGSPLPARISRLMLQLKVIALSLGFSGVSVSTYRQLLALLDRNLIPVVPELGSVGASGDLAPLAHLSLPLIGLGEIWGADGATRVPAGRALAGCDLSPVELQAKDGLALINGTQFMAACAADVLHRSVDLLRTADLIAAMSLEALQGSLRPFDPRIQAVRPHPGQAVSAQNVRTLLRDSQILESHRHCGKVQDPYCLRCVPQVHGASRDALDHAAQVTSRELVSATDNPLVFEDGEVVSGGNFHGQPLALAIDYAKIALAELGSISERRTYLLLEGHDGLPALLMQETGVNSGFMIPQYTAAAMVSENKVLCHPASVDSIPTSLGQEDHVSMGSIGALHLLRVIDNVTRILAIELFTACQALDFRRPLRPGRGVETAHRQVRREIPFASRDRLFSADIALAIRLIEQGGLTRSLREEGIELA